MRLGADGRGFCVFKVDSFHFEFANEFMGDVIECGAAAE